MRRVECPKCHSHDVEPQSILIAGIDDDAAFYQDYECKDCGHVFEVKFTQKEVTHAGIV